jgi:hypothetical protein
MSLRRALSSLVGNSNAFRIILLTMYHGLMQRPFADGFPHVSVIKCAYRLNGSGNREQMAAITRRLILGENGPSAKPTPMRFSWIEPQPSEYFVMAFHPLVPTTFVEMSGNGVLMGPSFTHLMTTARSAIEPFAVVHGIS